MSALPRPTLRSAPEADHRAAHRSRPVHEADRVMAIPKRATLTLVSDYLANGGLL